MKHILGLDLGTNSIGWAVISSSFDETTQKEQLKGIEAAGSRIIPMDAAQLGDFNKGNTVSQTANRTQFRGVRRLYERKKLRRERLHRILQLLGFLPKHYANQLDRYGKFIANSEPKLAPHILLSPEAAAWPLLHMHLLCSPDCEGQLFYSYFTSIIFLIVLIFSDFARVFNRNFIIFPLTFSGGTGKITVERT